MNAPQDFRAMTADSIGKDLLSALLAEIRLLPKPWDQIAKAKQDDIIDRLRARVETNVKMAVHLLSSQGRTVVVGDLEQITIKDGAKAVIKIGRSAESLHELYDAQGKAVLVIVSDAGEHTGGMDGITGEEDQRAMDLGHEYHDNDGGGMGSDDHDDSDVVDAELIGLPAPGETTPTEEQLDQVFDDGYQAAADGKPESDCPVMAGALCIEWVKGWKAYHGDQGSTPGNAETGDGDDDRNGDRK